MNKKSIKPLTYLIGSAILPAFTTGIEAKTLGDNPFELMELNSGYMHTSEAKPSKMTEGACGEGKCGSAMMKGAEEKTAEGNCAGDKPMPDNYKSKEGKCGEGKCGEGQCGGSKKK